MSEPRFTSSWDDLRVGQRIAWEFRGYVYGGVVVQVEPRPRIDGVGTGPGKDQLVAILKDVPDPSHINCCEHCAVTIPELILDYGGIDGAHHKQWVLDQVLRICLGNEYEDKIKEYQGDDGTGEPEYLWDEGIAP